MNVFSEIPHSKTSDGVVSHIELLILEGVLQFGDRLPSERDLSQMLNVSRPVLRDALKQLETSGLITSKQGGGTFIADVIGQVFSDPIVALIGRHKKATMDYLEYRQSIEGMTAEFAAQRASTADKQILNDIISDMKASHEQEDFERDAQLDVQLHSAIGEAAHNIILLHSLRSCYRLLEEGVIYNRAIIYHLPDARATLLSQHINLVDAIIRHDAPLARQSAEAHIEYIIQSTHKAERNQERERVANLRLQHRAH